MVCVRFSRGTGQGRVRGFFPFLADIPENISYYARISQDRSFRRFIECTGEAGGGGRPGEDRNEIGDNGGGGNGVKRRGEIYYRAT